MYICNCNKNNSEKFSESKTKNIVVLYTKWYGNYVNQLVSEFNNKLKQYGNYNLIFKQVSGSFDLISGAINFINKNKSIEVDCFVFIGILLNNVESQHHNFLVNSMAYGLHQFQLKYEKPIINGILVCNDEKQIKNIPIFNNAGSLWATALVDLF